MRGWALALAVARRELRSGITGFRIFLACLAIGVAAIALVGTVSESVVGGLRADARSLLGGDVEIEQRHRPITGAPRDFIRDTTAAVSEIVEMRAMARHPAANAPMLVELKAVDGAYPLVGAVDLAPAMALSQALEQRDGLWGAAVEGNVLDRLSVRLGDRVQVGEAEFEIRAVIAREPDRATSLFNLGPRFLISDRALPATQLIQPGTQAEWELRALLPAGAPPGAWMESLKNAFPDEGWRVRGRDEAAPGARRFIERMSMFLSFAGLTALLVGGIGVAGAVNAYLDGRMRTVAILKCLGAERALIFRVYLLQLGALSLLAVVGGVIVGAVLPPLFLAAFGDLLPVAPAIGVYPLPLLEAAGFGLLTALAFSLWPLSLAANVSASDLFRQTVAPLRGRPGVKPALAIVLAAAALIGLTAATVENPLFALWFVLGAAASLAILRLAAWALMRGARRLHPHGRASWRLALSNLHRPGAATPSVVVAIGLGAAVLVAVALVQGNLYRQIAGRLPAEAPALFFLDIQPQQVAGFEETVRSVGGTSNLERRPTLRGRIIRIAGKPVDQVSIAYDAEWAVRGDRALTYAAAPPSGAEIVAGQWWPADYRGEPLISLDAGLAEGFGVGVGDTLTVNLLGREITGAIANLREIDWRSLRFDFALIFSPGLLEAAPQTSIAAVHAPPAAAAEVERRLSERFSNITTVRVREALETATRVIGGVAAAIRASAAVTLVAGVLVVAGAIAAGRRRRLHDAVVFKVLGATRRDIVAMQLAEHAVLGLAAGAIAVVVGAAASWAIVRHVMGFAWTFLPQEALLTAAGCVAVATVAGLVETWRVLGRKAAPQLRND